MKKNLNDNGIESPVVTFLHSRANKYAIPVSGTFELTSRCNFKCKMCYIHDSGNACDEDELSTEEWLKIAQAARDNGTVFVLLTGGEPMVRKDFPILWQKMSEMGFVLYINTNGSLITDEIHELFRKYPPFRVNISLYGGSEGTYKSLCSNESFNKVIENIKRLKENNINVYLHTVITPYNRADIKRINDIASELELPLKAATYLYPPGRQQGKACGENPGRFSPEETARVKLEYERIHFGEDVFRKRLEMIFNNTAQSEKECLLPSQEEGTGILCRAGKSAYWVNYKGDMTCCGMLSDDRFNLTRMSFSDCWSQVRSDASEIRLPAECRSCKYKSYCNVCAAVCKTETGCFDKKPDYVCRLSESLNRLSAELLKEEEI